MHIVDKVVAAARLQLLAEQKLLTCGITKQLHRRFCFGHTSLLASTNILTTHLCNGGVALEAVSQSLATFNAQIVPIDVELYSTKTKIWAHKFKCK